MIFLATATLASLQLGLTFPPEETELTRQRALRNAASCEAAISTAPTARTTFQACDIYRGSVRLYSMMRSDQVEWCIVLVERHIAAHGADAPFAGPAYCESPGPDPVRWLELEPRLVEAGV